MIFKVSSMKNGKISKAVIIISVIIIILIIVGGVLYVVFKNKHQINDTVSNNTVVKTETKEEKVVVEAKKEYKIEDYIKIIEYPVSEENKEKYFSKYDLKQIEFKNLSNDLTSAFSIKQSNILAKAVTDVIEAYNEENLKKEAITECSAEINENLLSVKSCTNAELMVYPSIEYIYSNINLDTKKTLNTTEMITLFGYDKDKLIVEILNSLDEYSDNALKGEEYVSKADFLAKKPEFKKYITEHLNDFNVYSKDKKIYCDNFSLDLLVKLGYGYPTGGSRTAEIIELQK